MPLEIRNKLAKLIKDNPAVKTVVTPHTWMYFPGGISPIETFIDAVLLKENNSERTVEICLTAFSDCFLRANEIYIF